MFLVSLLWLVVVVVPAVPAEPALAAAPDRYYVAQTGHVLAEPFLSHWVANDGWDSLGYPVTEPAVIDGRRMQFFTHGVLSLRRTKASTTKNPQRLKTGAALLAASHRPDGLAAGRRAGGERHAAAFRPRAKRTPPGQAIWDATTRHAVSGRFRRFYDANGGAERFGRPISEAYVDGGLRVQWFEYGRLFGPVDSGAVDVAPVGHELAVALDLETDAQPRGGLPLLERDRFRRFAGDGTVAEAPGAFDPVRILIPRIGVNATIEPVGIVDGVMQAPVNAWNVGWYPMLAKPGERTNVVMAGHRDWWGMGPVVFWSLDQLALGDKVYLIGQDGTGATYRVRERFAFDAAADATPLIDDTGGEVVTLITCGGVFNGVEYLSRTIVRAERI